MHEFGHSLGLQHGGQDGSPYKPNHFSVMTYRAPRFDDLATPWYDRGHNYSEVPDVLDLCDLDENEPMVANSATEWATTWSCPDVARRGSGSILGPNDYDCDGVLGEVHTGSLFEGECMELREPLICVNAGDDGILDTIPGFDDRRMGGEIVPGADGALTTQVVADPAGNPLDDLVIVDGQLRIRPGLDGRLDSTADATDVRTGEVILPGGNLWCDTEAVVSDEQGFGLHQPNCAPDGTPGGIQPCNKIVVVDEWAILRFKLIGDVSGAYQGPPLSSPVEPTQVEVDDQTRRSSRADVGLSSTLATGSTPHGVTTRFTYDLVNFGPHHAAAPTLKVVLPVGTELVRCEAAGGPCMQHSGVVVAAPGDLAPGTTATVEIEVAAACDGTGAVFEVEASVSAVSFDPELANNTTLDLLIVEPTLDIGQVGRPWVKAWTGGVAMPTVPTSFGQALPLTCGYQAFESPSFDTDDLGATATELLVDLFIPQGSWGGWVGNLELYFEAPGLNLWNRWLASRALTALPRGQWVTVAFPLDSVTRAALAGATPGARFRFASNLGGCGVTVQLASVRLGGDVSCHSEAAPAQSTLSTSVLRFESMGDWTSSAGSLALESGTVSEGARAVRVGPVPWTRVESRTMDTSELGGVTSRFAVDVLVPAVPAATYWAGGLGLVIDCPDEDLHDRWVGYHGLQFLFEEQFNRLEFALAPEVVSVLDTPGVECRFAFELSTNPVVGSFVLDNAGFLPAEVP